uniref:Secreted protein n=1 Tax=Caenorhabditis tropicalis TaxID=1561998 RepID=A0A1I7U074_9PELO
MGACPPLYGKVLIFVAFVKSSMETHYKVAQESLQCYLKGTNYTVAMVDLDNDERVRNTMFAKNFLQKWGDWEFTQPSNWNGADNGVLQIHILKTVIPYATQEIKNCDKYWHNSTGYDTYMAYVTCCKLALGATRLWPGKVRIYRRAHGWVRDGFLTTDRFCDRDFMFHGWKNNEVGAKGWESPFPKNINVTLCGKGMDGWVYRSFKNTTCDRIRETLGNFERSSGKNFPKEARVLPHLAEPDVGECFPTCDDDI